LDSRRQYLVFFALVALVATAGFFLARRSPPGAAALSVVPDDAWLVLSVDVEALRASGLAASLKTAGSPGPSGLGAIATQCGFDPVARLRSVVVASPEGGDRGDFGVVFEADVSEADLSACATKVITERAGKPVTRSRSGFQIVEDASDEGHASLAYRSGGPFLVGRGEWLDRMIDRAARPPPASSESTTAAEHADLRRALTERASRESGSKPALVLTTVLPKDLRERLKSELGAESAAPPAGDGADRTNTSVLSVEAAGVAVTTGPPGSTTRLDADLRCDTASACDEVKGVLSRKRDALSRSAGFLIGLGALLDSLRVDPHGASLSLAANAPTDDLAKALARALPLIAAP
jgi:hypothetical protein